MFNTMGLAIPFAALAVSIAIGFPLSQMLSLSEQATKSIVGLVLSVTMVGLDLSARLAYKPTSWYRTWLGITSPAGPGSRNRLEKENRWISPYMGGHAVLVPTWMIGAALLGLAIYRMFA